MGLHDREYYQRELEKKRQRPNAFAQQMRELRSPRTEKSTQHNVLTAAVLLLAVYGAVRLALDLIKLLR